MESMTMTTTTTATTMATILAVLLVAAAAVNFRQGVVHFHQDTGTHHHQQTDFKPEHPDWGYFRDCDGGYYNLSWSPKEISPQDRIQLSAHLVSPMDFDVFHVYGVLLYEGAHLVTINSKFNCPQLALAIQNLFPRNGLRLECPVRRGQLLMGSILYTDTEVLIGGDGLYELKVTIQDMKGGARMCIDTTLEVLPFPDS